MELLSIIFGFKKCNSLNLLNDVLNIMTTHSSILLPNKSETTAVHILVVDRSMNNADLWASALRNEGTAAHANIVSNEDEYTRMLENEPVDFIIFVKSIPGLDFDLSLSLHQDIDSEAVFMVIDDGNQKLEIAQLMANGVREVIPANNIKLFVQIILKELGDLRNRRALQSLRIQLKEAEHRCTALIDSSRDAIAYVHEGMHVHANQSYLEMFGYSHFDDIEVLPIMDMISEEKQADFKSLLRMLNNQEKPMQIETECEREDETTFHATMTFSPAHVDGERCTQIQIVDKTYEKEMEEKLNALSVQDAHTGVANRQLFMDGLTQALEETQKRGVLMFIQIDNFRELQNTVGITNTDEILVEVAELIAEFRAENNLLARFGDNSFSLYNPTVAKEVEVTEVLADNIIKKIAEHQYDSAEQFIQLQASIGIAFYHPESGFDSHRLLDSSMRAAEKAGEDDKGGYLIYQFAQGGTPEGDQANNEMVGVIKQALAEQNFHLMYQPIVSLPGDSRENYAVTSRLCRKDGDDEPIMPAQFIPIASASGLMKEIDQSVIRMGIEELSKQRATGRKTCLFFPLSANSITNKELLLWIVDCLREFSAKGAWMTFQIMVTDYKEHIKEAKQLIEGLKKIRCRVSLTQFDGSPSSFSLLKQSDNIDIVRYTPELTLNIAADQDKQEFLTKITEELTKDNFKTIACQIEDANSLAVLWSVGVNYIQGYFLGEPSQSINVDAE